MPIITFKPNNIIVTAEPGSLLLDAARTAGLSVETPCGGRGVCGKCLVRIESGKVDFTDTGMMPAGMAADGYVLICRAKLLDEDVTVHLSAQLEREKGQFTKASDDRLLIDHALLPTEADFEPLVKKIVLTVAEPAVGDGLSDYDRLEIAVKAAVGSERMELPLRLLQTLPETVRQSEGTVTAAYLLKYGTAHIAQLEPSDTTAVNIGLAVDIGTTTVAVQVVNTADGRVLAAKTAYNTQIECGLDVISRINYARKPERLAELRSKVLGTINKLAGELAESSGVEKKDILNASVAGNTVMTHLLLGILPEYIRLDPYTPAIYTVPELRAAEVGLDICPEAFVQLSPSVGSYVGGDITSGLLCTSLATDSEDVCLFIDIGTNGELILGNGEFLMGCACSAGPAFEGGGLDCGMRASAGAIEWAEVDNATGLSNYSVIGGGKPLGICGSGMISLMANLFAEGWMDAAGKLDRSRPSSAIQVLGRTARYIIATAEQSASGRELYITEADIDNIIRAKAAIFSACRVMLRKIGMEFDNLARMYIAGGFGRYLDIGKAQAIGLIPALSPEKFHFIGNSSLMGSYMTLVSAKHREKEAELAKKITYLDLSVEPEYMDEYTAALFLPHTDRSLFE
jgi:uncharacterized 2Fe-2S/4Fe-4S cluster protein (DUF4445 family)